VAPGSQQRANRRPARSTRATRDRAPLSRVSGRDGASKLATRIASQIVDDVIAQGWPVGTVLGSSDDFLDQYDISRAVFREAVRLLEHQQVARTRRGPGGGLIVVEPSVDAIIDAAVLYLLRVDARLEEVFEARLVLEEIVTELAPARLDAAGRAAIRDLIAAEEAGAVRDRQALHSLLASLTGNPAIELFVDILNRVSVLYLRDQGAVDGVSARTRAAHRAIADAVIAGDEARARQLMREHLGDEVKRLRRNHATRQMLPSGVALSALAGQKRAEQVAREIFHVVVAGRLEPGHLLGSEPDLIERYGVSRAVFREAVRLLEHHQIATMRRGPGGGLFVAAPSSAAVADVVALYLARQGAGVAALAELRVRVEVELVDLVIDRIDPEGLERLAVAAELNETDQQADVAIHNLHAAVAGLSRNRALELVVLVLIRLTRLHQYRPLSPREETEIRREVNRTHLGIARAIESRDRELARKRMRRHLEVLPAQLR
jgi:DNA-binding FadR family transcriptional regulator